MRHGPNVQKLITYRTSQQAIPAGGGLPDAVKFLSSASTIADGVRAATEWVEAAIALVKTSPDNPYGDDDEAIAGEILRQIEEKKAKKR